MKKLMLMVVMFATLLGATANEIKKDVLATFDFVAEPSCSNLNRYKPKGQIEPKRAELGMDFYDGAEMIFFPNVKIKSMLKKPFGIMVDFTIARKSDGYCSGIIQISGVNMRLSVNKYTMKLNVAIRNPQTKKILTVNSAEPVELNRRVKFEVIADGENVSIYRDGKLDNKVAAPLPDDLEVREIMFGQVGGSKYFLNGTMHAAELFEKL